MPNFEKYFTLAHGTNIIETIRDRPSEDKGPMVDEWYEKLFAYMETSFKKPMSEFLKDGFKAQTFNPHSNAEGWGSTFANAWDSFVTSDSDEDKEFLFYVIERAFDKLAFDLHYLIIARKIKEGKSTVEIHSDIVNYVNTGTFNWFLLETGGACDNTGEYLYTEFENWEPKLGRPQDGKFIAVEPRVFDNGVRSLDIELKTGNLLVNDWFRVEGFNVDDKNLPSINFSFGIEATVRHYAEKHGFVSCFAGNSSPSIFLGTDGSAVLIGRNDGSYDEETDEETDPCEPVGFNEVGSTCTDLWWVSIIEEENLVDIVTRTQGDKAQGLVDAFKEIWTVTSLKVEPGMYTLYFMPRYSDFPDAAAQAGLDTGGINEPYFLLKKK